MGRIGGNALPVWLEGAGDPSDPTNVEGSLRTRVQPYTTVRTGELVSTVTAVGTRQGPNVPCDMVKIKSRNLNVGYIHIGWNAGVSMTDGIEDTSTGFILGPGDDTGWILVSNLNLLFYVGSVANERLTYIALGPD